jgi:hypothetical protein
MTRAIPPVITARLQTAETHGFTDTSTDEQLPELPQGDPLGPWQ